MSKCFISYRHTKPDEELAQFLGKFLGEHDHDVFLDTQIQVGMDWVKEIEKQIKSAEFFIVLLSKESILSDMVRQEVKLAHELAKKRGKRFTILPIRVDFTGELPYDLGAYLDRIQYALWRKEEDFNDIAQQVLKAIDKHEQLPLKKEPVEPDEDDASTASLQGLFDVTDAIGAPLPKADPRVVPQVELETGTVKLDSPFYVKRKTDLEIIEQIQKKGTTVIVKGSRQMGKSSLLVRAQAEAKKQQQQCCYLDFQFVDQSHLTGLDTLFQYLARKMCRVFKTTVKPVDCWDDYLGSKENITEFIKEALLEQAQSPILILMDEVDRLFNQPFRDDFFSTIRGWHNLRAAEECWNNLNLVIAHSTEPYLWIQDINQSPFNVGFRIELQDFDFQQVKELNARHGSPLKKDKEIQELIDLTGGQPYLVRLGLYTMVKSNFSISQLKETATGDRGPFGDHLRQILWRLQGKKGLSDSLRQILRKGMCDYEPHFLRLRSAGVVKGETRDRVQMRCQIYEDYLRKHL
ncbi:MAG: AAA-like domain-containing protein [Candidatus Aminicenantes bacterium]|jgi:hypothetical protein